MTSVVRADGGSRQTRNSPTTGRPDRRDLVVAGPVLARHRGENRRRIPGHDQTAQHGAAASVREASGRVIRHRAEPSAFPGQTRAAAP